jgi:hypothetical protein
MRDLVGRYGLAVSLVIVFFAIACSTYTHDAVQTNQPAPAVLRGASLTTAPPVNTSGPASMTTPTTEALAITAANQGYEGRVLGYIEGIGSSPSGNYTPPTGQLIPPSLYANPEVTVNSSISSPATSVITSGAGEGVFVGGVTAAATATPTAAALTAAATTSGTVAAAPVFTTAATVATPTNTANILTPGQFAAGPGVTTPTTIVSSGPLPVTQGTVLANGNTGTLTPTISSGAVPSPLVASNPPVTLATTNQSSTTTTRATTVAPLTASAVASARGNIAPILGSNATAADLNTRAAAVNAPITTVTNRNGGLRVTTGSASSSGGGNIAPINFGASGMTSSSTIENSTTTAPVTVAPITNESAPRRRAVQAPSTGTTEPAMQASLGRLRAVRAPSSVPSRQRPVRVTNAPDGTVVITNDSKPLSRDQQNPQQ